jgi:hypothetical protein
MLCDAREHARADFLAFVEGKHVIDPTSRARMRCEPACLFERPADATERAQDVSCLRCLPRSHATKRLRASSGSGSPLSIRSAITRSARETACALASASVFP